MSRRGSKRRRVADHARRVLISISVSVITLSLLFALVSREGDVSASLLLDALRRVAPAMVGLYVISLVAQTLFRAARYRLLLIKGGEPKVPGHGHMFLVTMARNMMVDLFPARVGELSYVAMLNRGYRVSGEGALSSLSISVLFDFLALALVLGALVLPPFLARAPQIPMAAVAALLGVVTAVGWWLMFRGFPRLAGSAGWDRMARSRSWVAAPLAFLQRLARTIARTRRSGAFLGVLAYSGGVRLAKYAGLYALFLGVTRFHWPELAALPVWAVLGTLILAEGAAGLPMPAFMSFGAYEAGGVTALVLLGFSAADAALAMLAMHVVSQALDYSLGGLALILFTFVAGGSPAAAPAMEDHRPARPEPVKGSPVRAWGAAVALALLAMVMAGFAARQTRAMGAVRPPGAGREEPAPPGIREALETLLDGRRGWIVWSSNRHGSHDILRMDLPDMRVRRLTSHDHTDTYPAICPEGRRIVFCRSRIPWVSQRDPVPWDVYLLDLATGEERLLARDGYQPAWRSDGASVVFVRRGIQVVEYDVGEDRETVLLESGRDGIPNGVSFQTPHLHADRDEVAVTLRGRRRAAVIARPGDGIRKTISERGCQLAWSPDGAFLYWIDHGGRMDLAAYRAVPGGERAVLLDLPEPRSHQYFPRFSPCGRFLTLGASAGDHEHDTADYEIFLWRTGTPETAAIRLTYHSGNDCWPAVFIEP